MALSVPKAPGIFQMLKESAKYLSGIEEAVLSNISACKQFSKTMISSYGPCGMNKLIVNHLDKLFVTNDAATIIKELEISHPAVKLIVLASQMQEQEVGDGTNYVINFSGQLLEMAEDLLRMGLTPVEITEGYQLALENCLEVLPTLVIDEIKDLKNKEQVQRAVEPAIMSKQCGNHKLITKLVVDACTSVLSEHGNFNVDQVRVCKILGSGLNKSEVLKGMIFKHQIETALTRQDSAKIAVYTCPVDIMLTETKGTVLIRSAQELMLFNKGEEALLENQIKAIADTGVNVIVSGGKFGDLALHYLNKYNIMGVRLTSKWDVRRICKTVGATALPRLVPPSPEEIGYCSHVHVDERGETNIVIFDQGSSSGINRIVTILLRGATENLLDDAERAIDDGINNFKALTRDARLLPGAGATEIELALYLSKKADSLKGLEQYSVRYFAQALEHFPTILAISSGLQPYLSVPQLNANHEQGNKTAGVVIKDGIGSIKDATSENIFDLHLTKYWALKYATQAACTILQVDQIIMAKQTSGPKPKEKNADDDD